MGTQQKRHIRIRGNKSFTAGNRTHNVSDQVNTKKAKNVGAVLSSMQETGEEPSINRPLSKFDLPHGTYRIRAKFHEAIGLLRMGTKDPGHLSYLEEVEKDVDAEKRLASHREKLSAISHELGFDVLAHSIESM